MGLWRYDGTSAFLDGAFRSDLLCLEREPEEMLFDSAPMRKREILIEQIGDIGLIGRSVTISTRFSQLKTGAIWKDCTNRHPRQPPVALDVV